MRLAGLTSGRTIFWLLATVVAAVVGTIVCMDGIGDRSGDMDIARALEALDGNPLRVHNQTLIGKSAADLAAALSDASAKVGPERPVRIVAAQEPTDPAWRVMPRTAFNIGAIVDHAELLVGEKIFRNVHLNPNDAYIEPESRERMRQWLDTVRPSLIEFKANLMQVAMQELDYQIQRGVAARKSYSTYLGQADDSTKQALCDRRSELQRMLEERGATPAQVARSVEDLKVVELEKLGIAGSFSHATRSGDDNIYYSSLASMPQTRNAAATYADSVTCILAQLLQFFSSEVGLDASACEA